MIANRTNGTIPGGSDRQAGEVKEKVGKVEEKVDEDIDKVKDALHKK
jgi:uncharacterized protein YjbJ (UPF0337 family)